MGKEQWVRFFKMPRSILTLSIYMSTIRPPVASEPRSTFFPPSPHPPQQGPLGLGPFWLSFLVLGLVMVVRIVQQNSVPSVVTRKAHGFFNSWFCLLLGVLGSYPPPDLGILFNIGR